MGNVKSFRMSDRTENMFNSLKTFYSKSKRITDSDILSNGIELQFEQEAKFINQFFRSEFERYLTNKEAYKLFLEICDLLEIISISDGLFLVDEFKILMLAFYGEQVQISANETELTKGDNVQYQRIKQLVCAKESYNEQCLGKIEAAFEKYYEENEE